ncbi:metallophosphoesterase family protein [Halostella litorea]|uniref:metallophosphoesterase family protein n=1 Tax=Halostella litorea TaxID=2528831 RepID=UPI001092C080|nr:metallophosphoesterase family protein [Halostella litorea]
MTTVQFDGETAERHRRIDPDRWDDIYVVGDVHGCLRELEALVDAVDPSDDDLLVFVGDLVRKGPDSAGVLRYVRAAPNAVSVRGNNEDKLLRGDARLPDLTSDDVAYLEGLPVALSWDDALVVHGGVDPRWELADHGIDDLLTRRSVPPGNGYDGPFWFERYAGPPRVFFGHTVLDAPFESDGAVGLDTGCVYGGRLTAYDFYGDEFVSVPARRTYEARCDEKVISPASLEATPR